MSKEEERAAVFRTTKVRTKLKGDASWMQRRGEPENESREEKPWIAEVRASRVDGTPIETSPASSPTTFTPSHTKSDTERAPASGFLIRGVFTKLDKSASSSTSNGFSRTTQFTKKPSESYKRIAPHTVRFSPENQEGKLSHEEQEKRTEKASSVLKNSAVRQRSYVLSAAKKYESKEKAPDTSAVNSSVSSFVAKRVEITDDDESVVTPAPVSTPPPSPTVPVTSVASASEPRSSKQFDTSVKTAVDVTVNEPVAPNVVEATPKPVKEDLPPVSVTEKDPFENMKPGCTKVATPLPELIHVYVQAVSTDPEPDNSEVFGTPLVKVTPASPTPVSPTSASPAPASPAPETPAPESPAPESPAPETPAPETLAPETPASETPAPETPAPETPAPETPAPETPASETPVPASDAPVSPAPVSAVEEDTVKTEPKPEPSPHQSSGVDTLDALSDTLIPFDTNSTSSKDDEPALAEDEGGSADSHTEDGVEQKPTPALSSYEAITADLLALTDGPEESAEPVPPSPGRWSQDLLTELDSLSTQQEEEKQTDETKAKEIESSADPFDPYPIGTTSPNSFSDLLQPLADISINSMSPTSMENEDPSPNMSSDALEYLTADIIPINTDTTSQNDAPGDQGENQQMLVKFERKSTDNDSPWDRWTSPTVYTITTTTDEEEEEKSPEDTQTVTTVTAIRETRSEPEPAMDRYETRTVMEEGVQTPEPETKKGFVYLKEYVNATEMSLHNTRDTIDSGSDGLTSSSVNYSYSSPSTYSSGSLSSTCTYCGELVGNDARITIEHLNINCHPACFKCGECGKPMGDLLYNMFLHGGKVHCESCYSKAFD
ncbi:hypothetical protein PAMA_017500 [Pampus argenteus]